MAARFLSASQIAEELGVSERTAYRLLPEMNPIGVGAGEEKKLLRVARIDFENWIRRQREERGWVNESLGADVSGTHGSQGQGAGSVGKARTAQTRRPRSLSKQGLSARPLIQPTLPRTRPLSKLPATSS